MSTDAARTQAPEAPAPGATGPGGRLAVRKTYKLFIGGAFPRSESGRVYVVTSPTGDFLANAALGSRKDVRDAVRAARGAFGKWSRATPYNRGQILYRIAEMMEGRRDQFVAEVRQAEGDGAAEPAKRTRKLATGAVTQTRKLAAEPTPQTRKLSAEPTPQTRKLSAEATVDEAIDRWVWYAGWADKIAQVYGTTNAVASPYLNLSTPEPVGVVGILAPPDDSLLGLVSVLAPVIVTGNTAVLLAAEHRPLPAVTLAEVLATSDLPAGVVNVLTGRPAEMAPWLSGHGDVDALDLTGVGDEALRTVLERVAAENLTRTPRLPAQWHTDPGTGRMTAFLEVKAVWHPRGG